MSDLIAELRACGTDLAESAANEIERCHARLEIDHCFRMGPEPDLEMIRESVPFEKRAKFPDAVSCRDATIALMEEDVAALRAQLAEVEGERDRLREALRGPFLAVLLDGRNEWGTHVLQLPGENLGHFHEDTVGDMEKNVDGIAEQIMSDAEALGYTKWHAVVTKWRVDGEGDEAYMEYRGISTPLTVAMFGSPEEQDAEQARAALEDQS